MPVYDSNGNLKVIGNLTTDVRESGSVAVPEAGFLDFRGEGLSNVSVTTSGNGAIITISSSGDGGGSGGTGGIAIASGSSGEIVTGSADFINFTGTAIQSVNISGSGVTVTVNTGSGGGGGPSNFSKSGIFLDPIVPTDAVIWRSDGTYTVSAVRAYLSGATASTASINTRVNTSNNLSSNLFVTTSGNWWVGDTPINTSVTSGDSLEIRLLSLSGSVKYVNIQVDLTSS